MASVTTSV